MPLITCPDCRKEISDSAPRCPNCGRPAVVAEKVHLVEKTSKNIKGWQAGGCLMFFVGLIMALAGHGYVAWSGVFIIVVSVVVSLILRAEKWWKHE